MAKLLKLEKIMSQFSKHRESLPTVILWDFDLSYGNVDYADSQYSEGFWIKDNLWYARLFQDPYFENLVKERFLYFYNNTDLLLEHIDNHENYLALAQAKNYEKWQT